MFQTLELLSVEAEKLATRQAELSKIVRLIATNEDVLRAFTDLTLSVNHYRRLLFAKEFEKSARDKAESVRQTATSALRAQLRTYDISENTCDRVIELINYP